MTVVKALTRNNESEIDICLGVTFKLDNDESQLPRFSVFFLSYRKYIKIYVCSRSLPHVQG